MKNRVMLSFLFALTLVLAACAPATATEAPTSTAMEPPTQASTNTPSVTDTPAATETQAATETSSVPVTGEATVMASQHPTFGPILVDGEGFSLYVFASDTQNGGISACTAECAAEWPPLMSQGIPVVSQGVDAAMLGTITREDGSIQVTYNGWPLYLFTGDAAPGDTNGQGMEGLWSLVSPAGAVVP